MILSDADIKKLINEKYLPDNLYLGPSSVDLTLSNSWSWLEPKSHAIILGEPVEFAHKIAEEYVLKPHQFVLASTEEFIRVPDDLAAYVEGRSSIGRLGLQIQNAGFIDAGFYGKITLELANQSEYPMVLRPGIRICQIIFVKMTSKADTPYKGKYNGQDLATPSRLDLDPEFQRLKK